MDRKRTPPPWVAESGEGGFWGVGLVEAIAVFACSDDSTKD